MFPTRLSLANLSIAYKLGLSFACILAVLAIMSALVLRAVTSVGEAAKVNNESNKILDDLERGVAALFDLANNARGYIITRADRQLQLYDAAGKLYADTMATAHADAARYPEILAVLDKVDASVADWRQGVGDAEIRLARDPQSLNQAVELAKSPLNIQLMKVFRAHLDEARSKINTWSAQAEQDEKHQLHVVRLTQFIGGAVAVVLAGLIGFALSRLIARPVDAMAGAMARLAAGDNSVGIAGHARRDEIGRMARAVQSFKVAAIEKLRLEAEAADTRRHIEDERHRQQRQDERGAQAREVFTGSLAAALGRLSNGDLAFRLSEAFAPDYEPIRADFNASLDKLQQTMLAVGGGARTIRSGTGEISTAADDLSRRTEQQAASLEETAASLDEITATVQRTADGAKQARGIVSAAQADAEKSSDVVRQAIEAMSGIEASSRQIGQIIGVIDEIAFQTNLLALNAGVEAARAGDAGRGFAVVASEVRALAQRSAQAAKEIKLLISNSTAQVDHGVDLVAETGEVLGRIVRQVAEIDQVVGAIAASAQEQSSGLQQVNLAVNQMDQVTQRNAAMVEETTAAARSLAHETEALSRLISQFELGSDPAPDTKASPTRARPKSVAAAQRSAHA